MKLIIGIIITLCLAVSVSAYDISSVEWGSSGSVGYWSRVGTVLSPITAGDDISTTGTGNFSKIFINMSGTTPAIDDSTGLVVQNTATGKNVGLSLLSYDPGMVYINFGTPGDENTGYIAYANTVTNTDNIQNFRHREFQN